MKDTPILMNAFSVRGILENRKSMTRRLSGLEDVNKNPSAWTLNNIGPLGYMAKKSAKGKFGATFFSDEIESRTLSVCPQKCPYGQSGDRLWVKETWGVTKYFDNQKPSDFSWIANHYDFPASYMFYRADGEVTGNPQFSKWRPSIFMPRWASRITLEITDIGVERVQDITNDGAIAEGLNSNSGGLSYEVLGKNFYFPYDAFSYLWDSINAKRGYSWESNPWVWVVSFRVLP